MRALIRRFLTSRDGAAAIEYALIAVLLSLVAIAGFSTMANSVSGAYNNTGEAVEAARTRYQ